MGREREEREGETHLSQLIRLLQLLLLLQDGSDIEENGKHLVIERKTHQEYEKSKMSENNVKREITFIFGNKFCSEKYKMTYCHHCHKISLAVLKYKMCDSCGSRKLRILESHVEMHLFSMTYCHHTH